MIWRGVACQREGEVLHLPPADCSCRGRPSRQSGGEEVGQTLDGGEAHPLGPQRPGREDRGRPGRVGAVAVRRAAAGWGGGGRWLRRRGLRACGGATGRRRAVAGAWQGLPGWVAWTGSE